MKKYMFILFCASLGMAMNGCKKSLLDTSSNNFYVEGNFWNSEATANAGLNGCYAILTSAGLYGGEATPLWEETASPNAYNYSNSMGFNFIAEGKQMPSSSGIIQSRWHDCYAGIGRCNTYLFREGDVEMDEDLRKRMRGEAHFLRALYYFMIENYYGGVPLILDPPKKETQSDLPRTPREEVVKQILADLDSAAGALPIKYGSSDLGRATKGAALALKARVLLCEASPLFNTDNSKEKWVKAAAAASAVMALAPEAGYDLFGSYRGLFLPANENNKEVIFDVQYIYPDLGTSFDLIGKQYNTNAPLLSLAEAYEMKSGLPITDPASGYNAAKPYDNRDPRLYATIVYPGDTFMGELVTPSRFAITGYGMKKYTIYDKEKPPAELNDLKGGQSETNYIVLRYADILLMYAEAQNEAVGPDATAYAAINKVRERAGMPDIPAGLNQADFKDAVHLERRIEFAGEGLYYNDIRRWKIADKALNTKIYTYNHESIETRSFNAARDYWWPIPQTQRDLNPALEQAPGY